MENTCMTLMPCALSASVSHMKYLRQSCVIPLITGGKVKQLTQDPLALVLPQYVKIQHLNSHQSKPPILNYTAFSFLYGYILHCKHQDVQNAICHAITLMSQRDLFVGF